MAQTCGRCGAEFDEPVDGGCPGCGRRIAAAGARPRRPLPAAAPPGGSGTWAVLVVAGLAIVGLLGWIAYRKMTAAPPAPAEEVVQRRTTLKEWEASVPPAKLVPAMDAIRGVLAKADALKREERLAALDRILKAGDQTEARVMLLLALPGQKGAAAEAVLLSIFSRTFAFQHHGSVEELGALQTLTLRAVLEHVDSPDQDVRAAAAACLQMLASPLKAVGGPTPKTLWKVDGPLKLAAREACFRLQKDADPETRASAEKALEHLKE